MSNINLNMKIGGTSHSIPFKEGMTVRDCLDQVKGKPVGEFRIILNGDIVTVDTQVPENTTELTFVGQWQNGGKKKV